MPATVKHLIIDNIRTQYLEAGSGRPVVLLHSGEFGASAALSWSASIDELAGSYRVIAPDWLGFGGTDKVYDFVNGRGRRLQHMARFLAAMDLGPAAFFGSSMGGSELIRNVAARNGLFDVSVMVLSSSGGFSPENEARRIILNYDATREGMRHIIKTLYYDPKWAADEEYLTKRYETSIAPGAWESLAVARFRSPAAETRSHFGQEDKTPYADIAVPTLLVAGANDPLREPGYAEAIQAQIPDSVVRVYENCGHFPHIEYAERFNADALGFLQERYPA
jgi:Predicted hydrolases or acyltransferases (alpha/beta hydrolase superfamily)